MIILRHKLPARIHQTIINYTNKPKIDRYSMKNVHYPIQISNEWYENSDLTDIILREKIFLFNTLNNAPRHDNIYLRAVFGFGIVRRAKKKYLAICGANSR